MTCFTCLTEGSEQPLAGAGDCIQTVGVCGTAAGVRGGGGGGGGQVVGVLKVIGQLVVQGGGQGVNVVTPPRPRLLLLNPRVQGQRGHGITQDRPVHAQRFWERQGRWQE